MILNFKVKNYLSFKNEAGFSMKANKKIRTLSENKNIVKLKDGERVWINKTSVFYGANASGKTNILKGLDFLKYITLNSFGFAIEGGINHQYLSPFLLDLESKNQPIEFEIEFLIEKTKYKYILKLNDLFILNEKLYTFEKTNEKLLLDRNKNNFFIEENHFGFTEEEAKEKELLPRKNQTFISVLANRDSKGESLATKIVKFFIGINFIDSRTDLTLLTLPMLEDEKTKETILNFITNADTNIEDIKQEEKDFNISKNIPFVEINGQRIIPNKIIETSFIHPVYKDETKVGNVSFNLEGQESLGTKRLFGILGPILSTIKNNGILLIDEVDTHMHFLLIENLIKVIHGLKGDGENNIGESQFIFNTHNLDLMDLELFKKDQIFFTSKNHYGATEIYSLDDFKDIQIRNNSDIKKAYRLGSFGAIPILSNFSL